MNGKRFLPLLTVFAIAVLGAACTQNNSGDQANPSTAPVGLNRFLLFPNPLSMNSGGFETDTTDYASAYYRAIDPNNDKDTIDKWKTQNQFGGATGTELLAVFRDTRDLGYGRRMTGRMNADGSVAFFVENYNVTPNATGDYSSILNVEAAIRRDTRWHVGTNAIEWSTAACTPKDPPDCNPNVRFAKYYNFSSKDGTRQLAVDLDGNGLKAMPGPCITCHGGRGDPLTPPDASTGLPRFPLVENALSRKRGDVQARLHGMNVDSFEYSPDIAGFSKAQQQATLKQFNQWILCTYPLAGAATGPEDACRVAAGANEWQGTAAEMIKAWYGGPGMTQPNFNDLDPAGLPLYVPTGWSSGTAIPNTNPPLTDIQLYKEVVAPFCRTCHILRGTGNEIGPSNRNDLDFTTLAKFQSYADRIKTHVFDRGTMPLAFIVYNDFWNSSAPATLANFIDAVSGPGTATSRGSVLKPGRPIASPGPNRMVRTGAIATLTAEDSLFASTFSWSQISSNPPGLNAIIGNPNSMIAQFDAPTAGDYVVQLTVSNGSQTDSKNVTITVDDNFPDPQNIKFAHVKNVLQNITYNTSQVNNQKCVTCHVSPPTSPTPPIFYNSFDRNGDAAIDATDDAWFLKALQGRVNLTEIEASPLLRKPSGNHHRGLMVLDVTDKSGAGGLSNYSILYNWILAGTPGGGVAANAVVNGGNLGSLASPVLFTFSGPVNGPYASPAISLDGSTSLGAITSFSWSVFGPPGPLGTPAAIANPNAASTTLTVFDVGTYVVQLRVSDGTSAGTDTIQRTIVVGENPITASFAPATGTTQVTFSGNPLRGAIALSSSSTGSPTTCEWQISGPAGATLGTFPTIVIDLIESCASTATLSVPVSAIGGSYTVQLTASNIASSTVDNFIVIAAAPGQNVANANFTFPPSSIGFTVNGTIGSTPTPSITGVTLTGSATGATPQTFTWSLPNGGGTAGCSTPAAGQTTLLPITRAGSCDVLLTVSNAFPGVSTKQITVTVTSTVVFSQVSAILGNGGVASPGSNASCASCHRVGGSATPSWSSADAGLLGRLTNQNPVNGPVVINFSTPQSSLLLVCPSQGTPCGMPSYASSGFAGGVNNANYDAFLTWIMNNTP